MRPKIDKILITYMSGFLKHVNYVSSIVKRSGLMFKHIHRKHLTFGLTKKFDLVLSIGGDGTFLRASHSIFDDTPIMGINPDPSKKEGFYTSIQIGDFEPALEKLLDNNFRIMRLQRLKACLGNRWVDDLALNEFYFGRASGYHMSKYEIGFKARHEIQKSSGVLVGTSQGSHSWIGSAGGLRQDITDQRFQFVVREPYHGRLNKPKIVHGFFSKDQEIILTPKTQGFILVIDSLSEYKVKKDEQVRICCSKRPLHKIFF